MRKFFAILIPILIVIVPYAILYSLISYGIVKIFGKEIYLIILFVLTIYFLSEGFIKKLKDKK